MVNQSQQEARETSYESKKVMMRAEHSDEIQIEGLGTCTVIQRSPTYYGPKLRIEPVASDEQYFLHAPGPNSELQLSDVDGTELRTVTAKLESTKQYDICAHCNEPLDTIEHRRRSFIGTCSGSGENEP